MSASERPVIGINVDLVPANKTAASYVRLAAGYFDSVYNAEAPPFVEQLLSEASLRRAGYFDPGAVHRWRAEYRLVAYLTTGEHLGRSCSGSRARLVSCGSSRRRGSPSGHHMRAGSSTARR